MTLLSFFSRVFLALLGTFSVTIASPKPSQTLSSRAAASTACGDIVNSGELVFEANLVYDCLTSVPFNAAVATGFLNYYNDSIQFQSNLAYLKNPPASYQQPAVDFVEGLGQIQTAINQGTFKNQYEFEATLQALIYSTHDNHVNLVAGILGVFSFGTDYAIASVSSDGIQLPKIYFSDDLLNSQNVGATWTPSAISKINGQDVLDYLNEFATTNAFGTLETHADFNQLMTSPAQDIQAIFNTWGGGATFYPGETLTFLLENGTTISTPWLAVYNSPGETGPLETGGDFYNFFVLGFYPASYTPYSDYEAGSDASATTAAATAAASSSPTDAPSDALTWDNLAYPYTPDVAQPDLGTYGGGFISGYFIGNGTAVLSIPSFVEVGDAVNTFSDTVALFLTTCKQKGIKKIVIDVQQNYGGDALLAFDTFKQFFPTLDPFGGSRLRATYPANLMGDAITGYWESLTTDDDDYYNLAADEWVSSDRINANTNRNFTSWAEFYGPHSANGDSFTTTQRYNLSSYIFDMESVQDFDEYFAVYGYGGNPANTTEPYAVEDIIILSDGLCSSTCAVFMEMMHHEAGVRTVVAGGYPLTGPMQTPSGSRGARSYSVTDILDNNIALAQSLLQGNNDPRSNFLPNRTAALSVYVDYMGINLRDQIRKGSDTPLQFLYEAANCRIFFTPNTFYNYTALWKYAADAIWTNPGLCVAGSTGYASTNGTLTTAPLSTKVAKVTAASPSSSIGAIIMSMFSASSSSIEAEPIMDDAQPRSKDPYDGKNCTTKACPSDYHCYNKYSKKCNSNKKPIVYDGCAIECYMYPGYCANGGTCKALKKPKDNARATLKVTKGFCIPPPPACASSAKKKCIQSGKSSSACDEEYK